MNYLKEESSFFHEKYEGFANSGCSLMFKIVQKRVEKKVFFDILLYYHVDGCGGKSCNSSFFSRYPNLETKLSSFDNQKKILSDLNNEVFVFNISSVCCAYSGNIGHNTVLIITNKDKDFSQLRAYYCDSFGQDMPKVLRLFLLKILGLKEENIDYLKFRQQSKSGYCAIFAVRNAKIVGKLMLDGASFKEINENKKLKCRPSVECLKGARINFLNHCNKKLGKKIIERIKSFSLSIDKLIKRVDKVCSLEKGIFERLEIWRSKLLVISKLVEERLDSGEGTTYLFFDLLSFNSSFFSF